MFRLKKGVRDIGCGDERYDPGGGVLTSAQDGRVVELMHGIAGGVESLPHIVNPHCANARGGSDVGGA